MKRMVFTLFSGAAAVTACCALGQNPAPDPRAGSLPSRDALWLDSVDLRPMEQEWARPRIGKSVDGNALTIGGVAYSHGIGSHAHSELWVDLKGAATRFLSDVGVDNEKAGSGSVVFEVWVDGRRAAQSGVMKGGQPPHRMSVDLTGARHLALIVNDAGDGIDSDHADWAGAMLLLAPGSARRKPTTVALSGNAASEPALPISMNNAGPEPAIHGPRIVGATPGRPFLFRIPATGDGPLYFTTMGLPGGLTIDNRTGIISGTLTDAGTSVVSLTVRGPHGPAARRKLVIVGGDHLLAQTPPLGWNSWNVWAGAVSADKVRAAADAMISSGLAAHGFSYVNIDDTWEGKRDADGNIQTNAKFPDMKGLADYVHAKGLKLGIYSSPGPTTCGGFEGSYRHEAQDAKTWGDWGIDYLKHDWCSYGSVATGEGVERFRKPYAIMREALDRSSRDIVYSLCQYGMGNVWEWGPTVGANTWRTTGDINDSWGSLSSIGFHQNGHEKYAGRGHWNDPDMLIVGTLGWGPRLHPTRLTPNEQITHITLWSLLSSPLLIGCDLGQMDPFTRALLTNDEVLDINQDPLGMPAGRKAMTETPGDYVSGVGEVWARPLFNGTIAVGLFNRGDEAANVRAAWSDLGITGRQPIRDVWQRKDLPDADGSFTARVPAHGAILIRIGRPQRTDFTP